MLTDERIMDLYFARNQEAIPATSEKYGPGCSRIARNILWDIRDVEESVNDTWLAAWNTIPPQRPNPLQTYLYRIVRNLATGRYHKNTAQKRNSSYDVALDELEDCLAARDGVEEHMDVQLLTELLNRFLAGLDRTNRVLFVRRYWYGDPVGELAKAARMQPNTVTVRLRRLREKLRQELEQEGIWV